MDEWIIVIVIILNLIILFVFGLWAISIAIIALFGDLIERKMMISEYKEKLKKEKE